VISEDDVPKMLETFRKELWLMQKEEACSFMRENFDLEVETPKAREYNFDPLFRQGPKLRNTEIDAGRQVLFLCDRCKKKNQFSVVMTGE
jgi:hypothetical protein